MREETKDYQDNCCCREYNFYINQLVDEIFICYDGGVNSYEPRDPIAINCGTGNKQEVSKTQTEEDIDA